MKKTLLITLILATLVSLLLCSCGKAPEKVGDFILATEITPETKAAADEVLGALMLAYEEDRPEDALKLLSPDFKATLEQMTALFDGMRKNAENPFVPMDEYYMTNLPISTTGESVMVKKSAEDSDYIELLPQEKNLYLAMYKADGEKITYTISVLLVEKNGKFSIVWIGPGELSYGGKDAKAIYSLAKELDSEGKTIPAYIYSCMLGNTLRPAIYYHYGNEAEMDDLCYRLFTAVSEKYKLPLKLSGTNNSSLYVIGIVNNEEHGVIPLLLVKTEIPTDNTSALRTEARKVVDAIDALSGKLSDSFGYVELHLTNDEISDEKVEVDYESVVLKLK